MTLKKARGLVSVVVVAALGVVCAPTVGAIPPPSPTEGPAGGGTRVSGVIPPRFAAVDGAASSGYGLDEEGGVWAWGSNTYGQLGNGTTTNSSSPVRVQAEAAGTLPRFTAIAARGYAGYGLDENGSIWAWGLNDAGQLGNGTLTNSSRPVRVQAEASGTLPRFTAIAAGTSGGWGLDENGHLWAWGDNYWGQLGNGTTTNSSWPVPVQAEAPGTLPRFTAITGGGGTGYGLDENGHLWAWGNNNVGQLGNGTTTNSLRPVRVQAEAPETLPRFTAIAAGNGTGFGLDEDGGIWAWGNNGDGQLGNGTTTNSLRPVLVQAETSGTLPRFTAIKAGSYSGYGLDENGGIWAWGYNHSGQLGDGTTTRSLWPVLVQAETSGTLPRFTAIAAGSSSGYGLDENGGIWAWGGNGDGELGIGTTVRSLWPVRILATVKSVTFDGVPGTDLSNAVGMWSVTSPAGCGPVPVEVSYGFGPAANVTDSAGVFSFGRPPEFSSQPASGPLQDDGQFSATVAVSGDQTPSVQWQSWDETSGWVDVPGATGLTLTVRPPAGAEFRAVATNCWSDLDPVAFTAYSDVAMVRSVGPPVPWSPSPSPSSPSPSPSTTSPAPSTAPSTKPSTSAASPSPSLPANASKVKSVAVAMKKWTMTKRTTLNAVALAYPIAKGAKLTWTSSNPKVAKVNASGKIRALKPGRTVITVKADSGKLARMKVTVVAKAVKAKTIKAALKSAGVRASKTDKIVVKQGKSPRLSVLPNPLGATVKKMPTYRSSKPKIASVDKTGLITAKKKGKTNITVTLAGKKTSLLIHVI